MAYNKEYYEAHKDAIKKNRDKYRNNPVNRAKINEQQREKYRNLSKEKKEARLQKQKDTRAKNIAKSRTQYRINQRKLTLKKYYEKYDEYVNKSIQYAKNQDAEKLIVTLKQMNELKEKIDQKVEEINNLEKAKELL